MHVPNDRRYTEAHEWALFDAERSTVRIGITDFAQDALGDIVYVDLPDKDAVFSVGDTVAEVESTKSVGEIYAPIAGTVVAVNARLDDTPEVVNSDPYGEGWFIELSIADEEPLADLLDAAAYVALTESD